MVAIFDVAQLQWTLKNQNGSIQIPASGPPSQAHLDLVKAGIITEPLLGINGVPMYLAPGFEELKITTDFTQRWIVDDNWTYTADLTPFSRSLNLSSTAQQTTLLVFYGIDTVANISVGGRPVAWVNNQFRQYTFDVSTAISAPLPTDNNLTVVLESAYRYALNVSVLPEAEHFPGNGGFEYPGIYPWMRKVASDFGWDWGPAFVPVGIYKPAYLVTLSPSIGNSVPQTGTPPISPPASSTDDVVGPIFVDESSIDIYKKGQSFSVAPNQKADWIVNVTLGIRSAVAVPRSSVTLSFPELKLTSKPIPISAIPVSTNESFWVTVTWPIPDHAPQRWYPHNLGTPKLYDLDVVLATPASGRDPSIALVNFVTRTGFRTIELAQTRYSQQDIDQRGIWPGDQWHFKVNGRDFYASGTNIIPFDPFYARVPTDRVRWILESAVQSGQNMLRVWGGGTYQPSSSTVAGGVYDFYSICDELGIMAWSELIFSDALYPINDFLLENLEPEVRQNVRRVNRHPSNVQWAGGNEIEGIVTQTNRSVENGQHFLNEYVTLFQDFLHGIVVSETHSVTYTDCSTTKGVLSLDPYILRFNNGTQGEIYGNGERYNYDASVAFDYTTFPVMRFMNEFGFHSMPSFYTWDEVLLSPDDFSFNSTVVMSRDHHPPAGSLAFPNPNAPEGQREMTVAVELWLPTPSTTDTNQTFAQWCWSTQIFHTMTMVSQVAWYRHGAGQSENNLGALVWQLNDIWQGVSWSSIEYSGRWKVLQYGLTGAFAPVTIYPFWTASNESLRVLVISDRWEDVKGSAQATWYDWLGKPLNTTSFEFTVPTLNNSLIFEAEGLNTILPDGKDAADVWLHLNVTADVEGKTLTNEQFFTPTSLANAHLADPQILMSASQDLTFTLSAKGGVGAWTWIDHPSGTVGVFVDKQSGLPSNGFYLIPGIDRTQFKPALLRVCLCPLTPMVALNDAKAVNATFSPSYVPTAIFIGGTSGIGQAMALHLARTTKGACNIVLIGRNRPAAESTLASFPSPPAGSKVTREFMECDARLMKNVHSTIEGLRERFTKVNFIVLTTGFLRMTGGRVETAEGIDEKLALMYYARWAFVNGLAGLLEKAKDSGEEAKVMSVAAGGSPLAEPADLDDLGMVKRYSGIKSMKVAPTYNDLMFEKFSSIYPKITFIHSFPGVVLTPLFFTTSFPFTLLNPLIYALLWPFAISAETCAEYMWCALHSTGPGFHRTGERAQDQGMVNYMGSAEAREGLWKHTIAITDLEARVID
ncbi:hypothetical protein DXG01_007744 [Tephrocybe rancida]|nr:hypothetical protein DXG01_007744 [Tephrocybe rancida]